MSSFEKFKRIVDIYLEIALPDYHYSKSSLSLSLSLSLFLSLSK